MTATPDELGIDALIRRISTTSRWSTPALDREVIAALEAQRRKIAELELRAKPDADSSIEVTVEGLKALMDERDSLRAKLSQAEAVIAAGEKIVEQLRHDDPYVVVHDVRANDLLIPFDAALTAYRKG